MERETGCKEYQDLSRRSVLKGVSAATFTSLMPAWLPRVALADSHDSNRDIMISIYLRGGIDGMSVCVPHGDNNYYSLRPTIAIPRPDSTSASRAIDLDGFFGVPQALANLIPVYQQGDLLFVHATGLAGATKSHFDAQKFTEVGIPGTMTTFTGWLGRHLMTSAPISPTAVMRGINFGYSVPRTLVGGPLTVPVPDPANYNLTGTTSTRNERRSRLDQMYDNDTLLSTVAQNTQNTIDLLIQVNAGGYVPAPGITYGTDSFNIALKNTAALIKANVGVEAIHIDMGGWDTHASQGPMTGTMATLMTRLANGLAALYGDLNHSGHIQQTTIMAMSEFGRVARENGSAGTDHGYGNMMMLLGGGVIGGRVYTQWPGLAAGQLHNNQDLAITLDYRDVIAEVVRKRLGNSNISTVLPGYTPTERGLVDG